jgi:penicillin-binding protein 2
VKEQYFPTETSNQDIKSRAYWLLRFIIIIVCLYLARAYSLQIHQGDYFKELADNNRLRAVTIAAPRGLIYDRHGTLLVNNTPEFNLYAVVGDMPEPHQVFAQLAQVVTIEEPARLFKEITKKRNRFSRVKVKGGLSLAEIARVEGNLWNLPGIRVEAELKRHSIYGPLAAHSIGYVGEISKTQMTSGRFPGVRRGDRIGQFGIEQTYDPIIRGYPGKKWIEVDVLGQELQPIRLKKPVEGNDVFLTLDLPLQKVAEEALGEQRGSIVAMDPNNGEVLALVSHPSFDPNLFYGGATSRLRRDLLSHPDLPLMNRAIQGQYPPGSTFKIIVGAATLETQGAAPAPTVECHGSLQFGNRTFRDWKKQGHGHVDFHRSLVESCDVYYYQMGSRVGIDAIAQFSNYLGLGVPTGIRLPGEKPGLIPSTEWKQRRLGEPWYPGETLSVAIGQGYVLVTPMQMAVMMSAVANEGTLYPPKLILKSQDPQTGIASVVADEKEKQVPILKETLTTIKKALADVVVRGTAAGARSKLVAFAGKTGTAQVVEMKQGEKRGNLPKHLDDHAWFVSYAPVDDPKIAVVVLVEHGGHGGSAAAPLAKKVIEAYLVPDAAPPALPEQKTIKQPNPVQRAL